MVEETRTDLPSVAYGPRQRWLLEALLTWRMAAALVVGLATLALLQAVFQLAPLARLPAYPAVVLAFLVAVVLPGLFLQQALLAETELDPSARLAAAPALGIAIAALPGVIALSLHLDLRAFGLLHSLFAATACGASTAFLRETPAASRQTPERSADRGGLLVLAVVGVVAAVIVTSPVWAGDSLPANYDTWTYMAYVRDYIDTDRMNAEEPFLGTGDAVNPRMLTDVWVVLQALIADATEVPPPDVLIKDLGPVLVVFALLATYGLTRTLFRSRTIALLAVALQLGYAFLDLSPHEGFGRNFFFRISEDKMVADQILFPLGLLFAVLFVSRPGLGSYLAFVGVALALSVVHPIPLFFLGVALVALAALQTAMGRTSKPLESFGLLLVPVAVASIGPFVQRMLLGSEVPGIFATTESSVTFRNNFRIIDVGGGLLIGNYHMIFHPLLLAAILLAPVLWLRSRRQVGTQLFCAITVGALLLFFVPPLATAVAKVMTPQTLWRMPRMIPVAAILAYACYHAAVGLEAWGSAHTPLWRSWWRRSFLSVGPVAAASLLLAAAFLIQEQYLRFDHGSFFTSASPTSILPGTDGSVFLGGKDYILSSEWRLGQDDEDLFEYLARSLPKESVVLLEPLRLNHYLPGLLTDVYPVDFGGVAGEGERREDATAFAEGRLSASELNAVVDRYVVDYIVAREVGPAYPSVESFSRAQWLAEIGPYQVYQVRR